MNRSKVTESPLRLNLLVQPKTKELLNELSERTGASNMTEVIRRSLALYDLVSKEVESGKELWICSKSSSKPGVDDHKVVLL